MRESRPRNADTYGKVYSLHYSLFLGVVCSPSENGHKARGVDDTNPFQKPSGVLTHQTVATSSHLRLRGRHARSGNVVPNPRNVAALFASP